MSVIKMNKCECTQASLDNIIHALGDMYFADGKQGGKSFHEVYVQDKEYVRWVSSHDDPKHSMSFGYRLFNDYINLCRAA